MVARLCGFMDALLVAVEEETALVRAGRLREAALLEPRKSELSSSYLADSARVKASLPYLKQNAQNLLQYLQQRHAAFHALLQTNLTVLATAHAVSESIVREVVSEVTRKNAPQTYGASGRQAAPARGLSEPVTVSRTL